ncbi:MAG: hypothetical protein N2315_01795 [Thermanaerothrix sp.]|nr:hypothetical protein [Thermanaerothrix sp.]
MVDPRRLLGLIGLMRRRGVIAYGQDRAMRAVCDRPSAWVVLASGDCPDKLLLKFCRTGCAVYRLNGVDSAEVGCSLGTRAVNVVAIPLSDPMGRSLASLLEGESDTVEQDKGL